VNVLRAIDLAVPVLGGLATAGLAAAGLGHVAIGALCGTVIAALSWTGLHVMGRRLVSSGHRSRDVHACLMGFKRVFIASLVLVSVTILGLNGIGVAVGLSSLPAGIILMVTFVGTGSGDPREDDPATEVKGDA
jgi:hypothetical protein